MNIQPWCTLSQFWTSLFFHVPFWLLLLDLHKSFLRRQVRWSGIPISLRIFQFVLIHTIKYFSIFNKEEVYVFLEFSHFFYDLTMLEIWSVVPLSFLNPACTMGSCQFTYCGSLAWRILSMTLLACEMSTVVSYFEYYLAFPFLEIGMKTGLFQSCGHCRVFQICWHIECSTSTASSFRTWNTQLEFYHLH